MVDLIDPLLARLGDDSPYRTANLPPPEIVERSPRELTRNFLSDIPGLIPNGGIDARVLALDAPDPGAASRIPVSEAANIDGAGVSDHPLPNRQFLARRIARCRPARKGADR